MKLNPLIIGFSWMGLCVLFYLSGRWVEAGISLGLSQVWLLWDNISDMMCTLKLVSLQNLLPPDPKNELP